MAVRLYRSLGSAKLKSHLLVQRASDHQCKDLALARGQRCDERFERTELIMAPLQGFIAKERAVDGCQQYLAGYWFREEVLRAGLDREHAGGDVTMAGQKDDGPCM